MGRVANMVLIYSYVRANKNSQTAETGARSCATERQSEVMARSLFSQRRGDLVYVYRSQTLLAAPPLTTTTKIMLNILYYLLRGGGRLTLLSAI